MNCFHLLLIGFFLSFVFCYDILFSLIFLPINMNSIVEKVDFLRHIPRSMEMTELK